MRDGNSKRGSRSRPAVTIAAPAARTAAPVKFAPIKSASAKSVPVEAATIESPTGGAAPIALAAAIASDAAAIAPAIEAAEPKLTKAAAAPAATDPPAAKAMKATAKPADDVFSIGRTALGAFAESQNAVARGVEAMTLEAAVLARNGFSVAADAATAFLGVRTFADAIEVQTGFARRSIDAALDGSVRLSEIAVKATAEASRPILARLDAAWRVG